MDKFVGCIKNRVNRLMNMMIDLNCCYWTVKMLQEHQYSDNEVMNLSPAFFRITKNALISKLFIDSAKLLSHGKDDESIYNLLIESKNIVSTFYDQPFTSNHFSNFYDEKSTTTEYNNGNEMMIKNLARIDESKKLIDSIKRQRNKYYAHYDRDVLDNPGLLFEEYSVSLENFATILLLSSNICNDFMNMLFNKTVYPFVINGDDLINIIKFSKSGMRQRR